MNEIEEGFEAVAGAGDVGEGKLLGVKVAGRRVVLARLGGQVYAIGSVCTHKGGDLAKGGLEGEMVKCPLHNSGFNMKTGEAIRPPAKTAEPVYDVRVEQGRIWVSQNPRS